MEKLHAEIIINAPREKVWNVMLDDITYRQWTKAFDPGSHYRGNWDQGSKILFVGPSQDGKGEMGMVSRIKENRKPEYLSIEHIGILKDGIEDTTSEEARKWAPAYENYTFTEKDGATLLSIDQDIEAEYKEMFEEKWKEALTLLKDLAERN